MNFIKKILVFGGLVVFGVGCILSYWSQHLVNKAQNTEDKEKRVRILDRASDLYPLNQEIYYELGEAHLSMGVQVFDDPNQSEPHLERAVKNYEKSLGMNPVSSFSHFGLAQAFYNMSFFTPSLAENSFHHYRNAALLAGHHTPIFFKVGTLFLSRWEELNEESRAFTLSLLKRIVQDADNDEFNQIMQIWDMNVKDYEVMDRILPERPWLYRMYARFLGEKSLSLSERQQHLAEAESLDFKRAQEIHEQGENDYFYYQMEPAFSQFQDCLDILEGINFYQRLTGQSFIDMTEFEQVQKLTLLYLVKSGLESGKAFEEVKDNLMRYLSLEDKVSAVREVDEYLQRYQIIGDRLKRNFGDMELFSFHMYLSYKENRYRDIMRIGRDFRESFVVVPKKNQNEYVEILRIVGNANQKVDYIYDAVGFYQQALEIEPDNLETLVRLRQSLIRLNKEREVKEINKRIEQNVSAQVKEWEDQWIEKGQNFFQNLVLDGNDVILTFCFENKDQESAPLVSIFWNDRVVWEDYLESSEESEIGEIFLSLKSEIGKNKLRVMSVNQRVKILGLEWKK